MISRTTVRNSLRRALDGADPNKARYPEIRRERIMYPMKEFTHALFRTADKCRVVNGIKFRFPPAAVEHKEVQADLFFPRSKVRCIYSSGTGEIQCQEYTLRGAETSAPVKCTAETLPDVIHSFQPRAVIKLRKKA